MSTGQGQSSQEHITSDEVGKEILASLAGLSDLMHKINIKLDGPQAEPIWAKQEKEIEQGNTSNFEGRFKTGGEYQRRNCKNNEGVTMAKITLEKFDPDKSRDIRGWILQMETYFSVYAIPEHEQVSLASLHLYGRALKWYSWWLRTSGKQAESWQNMKHGLITQYEDSWSTDYFAQLTRLQQTSSVQEFTEQFQVLQCLIPTTVPPELLLETYISGLKPPIRYRLKAMEVPTLDSTIKTARCVEAELRETRPTFTRRTESSQGFNPNWNRSGTKAEAPLTIRSNQETSTKEEHMRKGTCFKCGAKWNREHQCAGKKVYMINTEDTIISEEEEAPEEIHEEVEEKPEEAEVDELLELDTENVHISLQAITGQSVTPQTLRFQGMIKGAPVAILVDSGSTHNFINRATAKKLGIKIEPINTFQVSIANGKTAPCGGFCKKINLQMGEYCTNTCMFAMQIGGVDAVLGIQWLQTLGNIVTNYMTRFMCFRQGGRKYRLQAPATPRVQLQRHIQQQDMDET